MPALEVRWRGQPVLVYTGFSELLWLRVGSTVLLVFAGFIAALLLTPPRLVDVDPDLPRAGRGRLVRAAPAARAAPRVGRGAGPSFTSRIPPRPAPSGAELVEVAMTGLLPPEGLGDLHAALDALRPTAAPLAPSLEPRVGASASRVVRLGDIGASYTPDLTRARAPLPHPRRNPRAPTIIPEYDRAQLRGQIRAGAIPVVERCYEQALTRDPRAGGKLIGDWRFNTAGQAVAFDARPAYGALDAALVDCVRAGLKAIEIFALHPATRELRVVYPFVLTPTVHTHE